MSSKEKKEYQANRERIFEIYGIDPKDRRFDTHHLIFRSDFKKPNHFPEGYCDSKANLISLLKEEHRRLHEKVNEMEGERIIYEAPKRRRRKPKRKCYNKR